jgi:glycerol-3-phosphate dehydrogenase
VTVVSVFVRFITPLPVAEHLSGNYIKTKITDDIIGTEYAAMLKTFMP